MRHVSPQLAELTAHAQALTCSGDLTGARAVLADALAPNDTDPHRASPDLAEAAALHARVLITLGDPHTARDWACFAHTAQRLLYGPDDQRTLAAAATHATVLHRVGNHALAVQLYRDVVEQLTGVHGPDSLRVLAAQADLAIAEHAAGEFGDAHARLADAWQRHRRLYGDAAPAGIKMLARLGAMERDCGQLVEAQEHLALAAEFCARYLPGDHRLTRQVVALARSTGPDESDDLRLPVPVHDVEPHSPRRPFTIAAVVTAGALVAAGALLLTLPRDDDHPPAGATTVVAPSAGFSTASTAGPLTTPAQTVPTPTAPTPTTPALGTPTAEAAPSRVSLRDARDSVALTWAYPSGAHGPVLISGGRTGQERRAFQQLPAGSVNYVVYGLNNRTDYCFTVAVVYSVDNVAMTAPVCTSRG